jgi:hypothetical protein
VTIQIKAKISVNKVDADTEESKTLDSGSVSKSSKSGDIMVVPAQKKKPT